MQRQSASANWIFTAATDSSSIIQPGDDGRHVVSDILTLHPPVSAIQKVSGDPHHTAPHLSAQLGTPSLFQPNVVSNEAWTSVYPSSGPRQDGLVGDETTAGGITETLPYRLFKTEDPSTGAHNPTPFMTTDLAILSAERYDDGTRNRSVRLTRKVSPNQTSESGPGPRKRAKVQPKEPADVSEEDNRRSRGRPRLDTKDETPAEVSTFDF